MVVPPVVTIAIVVIVAIAIAVTVAVMVMVVMMMVHRMSRGRLHRGGQRARCDKAGHESGSERALEHDDLLDP
ncbi:hypothetical protein [Mesorhizobium sp.]|uniref:hypothetical protein n=1 Tax=Mesorhizobium sp. TaxID=1871066 RepID=UPI0034586182